MPIMIMHIILCGIVIMLRKDISPSEYDGSTTCMANSLALLARVAGMGPAMV